jgi:hypothetical protein
MLSKKIIISNFPNEYEMRLKYNAPNIYNKDIFSPYIQMYFLRYKLDFSTYKNIILKIFGDNNVV